MNNGYFSFTCRDRAEGHWDVHGDNAREFTIRGTPDRAHVTDERGPHHKHAGTFISTRKAMAWITRQYVG